MIKKKPSDAISRSDTVLIAALAIVLASGWQGLLLYFPAVLGPH